MIQWTLVNRPPINKIGLDKRRAAFNPGLFGRSNRQISRDSLMLFLATANDEDHRHFILCYNTVAEQLAKAR